MEYNSFRIQLTALKGWAYICIAINDEGKLKVIKCALYVKRTGDLYNSTLIRLSCLYSHFNVTLFSSCRVQHTLFLLKTQRRFKYGRCTLFTTYNYHCMTPLLHKYYPIVSLKITVIHSLTVCQFTAT